MANLVPTQVEQLQSIGAYLRQVRQEQGLSLDTLANQIFIRPALLQALETGRGDQLPEPVFIQGFIRRYAEALGLDGKTLSQEFLVTPVEVLPTPELITPATANGARLPVTTSAPRSPEPTPPPEAVQPVRVLEKPLNPTVERSAGRLALPLWLGLGALALALGGGLWALWGRTPQPATVEATPEAVPELAAEDSEPMGDQPEPGQIVDPETPGGLAAPIVVKVNLSDLAWLSVVADGKNVYEGTPASGYEETWTAQRSLVFRTGNAGGVRLSVNGARPLVLGETGEVRTLTLTPDSGAEALQSPD